MDARWSPSSGAESLYLDPQVDGAAFGLPDKIQDAQLNVNIGGEKKTKTRAAWEVDVTIISFLKVEKVSQCELKYLANVIQ